VASGWVLGAVVQYSSSRRAVSRVSGRPGAWGLAGSGVDVSGVFVMRVHGRKRNTNVVVLDRDVGVWYR
jgi:hypothetical protein